MTVCRPKRPAEPLDDDEPHRDDSSASAPRKRATHASIGSGSRPRRVAEDYREGSPQGCSSAGEEDDMDVDPELIRLREALASSKAPVFLPDLPQNGRGGGIGRFDIRGDVTTVGGCKVGPGVGVRDALVSLHDLVSSSVRGGGVTWGEGDGDVEDPRRRMYGFMPGMRRRLIEAGIRIQRYGGDDHEDEVGGVGNRNELEHDLALSTSSIDLSFSDESSVSNSGADAVGADGGTTVKAPRSMLAALSALTGRIRSIVPQRYRCYVTMENLIAVQPNHHNGAHHLPLHLDFPRNDGFGVVIATFAVRSGSPLPSSSASDDGRPSSSTVILVDEGDEGEDAISWSFELLDGDCYVLCGDARNKCVHGVLSSSRAVAPRPAADAGPTGDEGCFRETLNLRYGLHTESFAEEEIGRHWPD